MVIPTGIEPVLPAWEAGVLTARRRDHVNCIAEFIEECWVCQMLFGGCCVWIMNVPNVGAVFTISIIIWNVNMIDRIIKGFIFPPNLLLLVCFRNLIWEQNINSEYCLFKKLPNSKNNIMTGILSIDEGKQMDLPIKIFSCRQHCSHVTTCKGRLGRDRFQKYYWFRWWCKRS